MKKQLTPQDLIKTTVAQNMLGVSPTKMARFLRDGYLRYWTSPLDARVKLVSRAEVQALKERYVEAA